MSAEINPSSIPTREVFTIADMAKWEKSEAYKEYTSFILALNAAVKGKPTTATCLPNVHIQNLVHVLDTLHNLVNEIPPIEQPQRFGNKAFHTWYKACRESALPEQFHFAIPELSSYLTESFGNATRIDYGTGHEMSFAMFLCCLFQIGLLKSEDRLATVCQLFQRYLQLVRSLQLVYRMEPAGSHGAWSLDDYQFLPFLWGSSQLIGEISIHVHVAPTMNVGHPKLEPKMFPDEAIARRYASDFMFLECIKFIFEVKTGPFAEHSNQLWNISGVATWEKVNQGLIKMYKKEVSSITAVTSFRGLRF